MPRILIVRHAQSAWNAEGRWQGSADPPLSSVGVEQAGTAGRALMAHLASEEGPGPVTSLWSSGLSRAATTAALIAAEVGWSDSIEEIPDLREHDVGEWSGLTRVEIEARWPGLIEEWSEGRLDSTPGGESRGHFDARVRAGIHALGRRAPDGLAVVVSHGGVLRAITRWLELPARAITNLDGYLLAIDDDQVRRMADIALLNRDGDHVVTGPSGLEDVEAE